MKAQSTILLLPSSSVNYTVATRPTQAASTLLARVYFFKIISNPNFSLESAGLEIVSPVATGFRCPMIHEYT